MARTIELPGGDFAALPWRDVVLRLNRPNQPPMSYPAGVMHDSAPTDELRAAVRELAEGTTNIVFIAVDGMPAAATLERLA